jgi:DNA-directed RNA polymerase subunit RPC12/RpoP
LVTATQGISVGALAFLVGLLASIITGNPWFVLIMFFVLMGGVYSFRDKSIRRRCPHCGGLSKYSYYCSECGEIIGDSAIAEIRTVELITCPHCGEEISGVGEFCPLCGKEIK